MSRLLEQIAEQAVAHQMATFDRLWEAVEECSSILKEIAPGRRRPWMAHVIAQIYDEQGGVCPWCSEPLDFGHWHVDHRVPFTFGGGNERGNLQVLHPRCNQQKGDAVDVFDLLKYLEDRYMNLNL
ncbi:HNH endonuclease [Azospirillum brasilense]|uniref:HNH endonuclease n=1 Tax=Azospirillum brasilense TaxID=192 RepID=A0A6L3B2A9_AZOBR|nr:HNH endonuclease signature motif containing protein [Azospirillum brasilense]KAA0686209.1 HNH endonuclease [Azospirillum brasilense]